MKTMPARTFRCRRPPRRAGAAAIEAVISIAVTVVPAAILFGLAVVGCRNLYHAISCIVGLPYL